VRKFLSSALLLSAALVTAAEAGTVKSVDKRLDIGGSARVGMQYSLIDYYWRADAIPGDSTAAAATKTVGEGYKNGAYSIVSNESTLFFKGHQHLSRDARAYFDMTFDINMAKGEIARHSTFVGERFMFVGYGYKGFDVKAGSLAAVPYEYVGKNDDKAFGAGYHAYSSDFKLPNALTAKYSMKNGIHASVGISAWGEAELSNGGNAGDDAPNSPVTKLRTRAFGIGYTKGCWDIGYAHNEYMDTNQDKGDNLAQSEQFQTTVRGGKYGIQTPNYNGLGASYKFSSETKYPRYLTWLSAFNGGKLSTQWSNLKRDDNEKSESSSAFGERALQHTKFATIDGTLGTGGLMSNQFITDQAGATAHLKRTNYVNTSYSWSFEKGGFGVRYSKGFMDNYSDSILLNYERKLAKNIAVRTELFVPEVYAYDIFNWHGRDMSEAPFKTFMVDLRYDF